MDQLHKTNDLTDKQKEFILKKGQVDNLGLSGSNEYIFPIIDNDEYWEKYSKENLQSDQANSAESTEYQYQTTEYQYQTTEYQYQTTEYQDQTTEYEKLGTSDYYKITINTKEMDQTTNSEIYCKVCGNDDLYSDKEGKFKHFCYVCKENVKI